MRRQKSEGVETKMHTTRALITVALYLSSISTFGKGLPTASAPPAVSTRPAMRREVIISIPDRKLAVIENRHLVKVYRVAVGTHRTPSPHGRFRIANRIPNPTYYHRGVVIGPGHRNPLGNRWMGLNVKGYGIHGTNEPGSIGQAASHGCIRMGKRDVEDLFRRVRVGDTVEIYGSPNAEMAAIFHPELVSRANLKSAAQFVPASARQPVEKASEF